MREQRLQLNGALVVFLRVAWSERTGCRHGVLLSFRIVPGEKISKLGSRVDAYAARRENARAQRKGKGCKGPHLLKQVTHGPEALVDVIDNFVFMSTPLESGR